MASFFVDHLSFLSVVRHRFVSATTDVKEMKTQLFCCRMAGITCSRELLLFSHFAQSCQKIEDWNQRPLHFLFLRFQTNQTDQHGLPDINI